VLTSRFRVVVSVSSFDSLMTDVVVVDYESLAGVVDLLYFHDALVVVVVQRHQCQQWMRQKKKRRERELLSYPWMR